MKVTQPKGKPAEYGRDKHVGDGGQHKRSKDVIMFKVEVKLSALRAKCKSRGRLAGGAINIL